MTAWRREFGDAMELTNNGIELEDFSRTLTIFKIQNFKKSVVDEIRSYLRDYLWGIYLINM